MKILFYFLVLVLLCTLFQPGQNYSYEQSAYPATSLANAAVAPGGAYAQSEYGQPAYTLQGALYD